MNASKLVKFLAALTFMIVMIILLATCEGCEKPPAQQPPPAVLDYSKAEAVVDQYQKQLIQLSQQLQNVNQKEAAAGVDRVSAGMIDVMGYLKAGDKHSKDLDAYYQSKLNECGEQIKKLQQDVDDARGLSQYVGAFRTVGVICGVGVPLGVFLWVSGLLSIYPKASLGLIAGGIAGIIVSVVAPELAKRAPIVGIVGMGCLAVLMIVGLVYIVIYLWAGFKQNIKVIHGIKTAATIGDPAITVDPADTVKAIANSVQTLAVQDMVTKTRELLNLPGDTVPA